MQDSWQFEHVGLVIHNLDQAIDYYQGLGFETFGPEITSGSKSRIRFIQKGLLRIELIQPGEQSPSSSFLETQGEGATHFCFSVDDLDKEIVKLTERGIVVLFRYDARPGQEPIAYVDTRKVGNIMTEFKQRPK